MMPCRNCVIETLYQPKPDNIHITSFFCTKLVDTGPAICFNWIGIYGIKDSGRIENIQRKIRSDLNDLALGNFRQ